MLNHFRAQPARLESTCCPGLPPRLSPNSDRERAPVTFAWFAYTATGRTSKCHHLVTLYRLDRIGRQGAFIPSQYYGISIENLREMLRARQQAALPKIPAGYSWIGPEVVEDIPAIVATPLANISRVSVTPRELPRDPAARLRYARLLAADILRERERV